VVVSDVVVVVEDVAVEAEAVVVLEEVVVAVEEVETHDNHQMREIKEREFQSRVDTWSSLISLC
jgi:hypothetical protein